MKTYNKSQITNIVFLIFTIALFTWLTFLGTQRLIARDEGFYLYAARLVFDGYLPYSDFFYPQAPILPYFYALFFWLFDTSWPTARLIAIFWAALTTILTMLVCKKHAGNLPSIIATILVATCNIYWAWITTAQSYGIALSFLMLSFLLWPNLNSANKNLRFFLIGLTLSIAGLTRLYLFGLTPVFLLGILSKNSNKHTFKSLVYFSLGCLLPIAFILIIWHKELDILYFNLIGYHFIRADHNTIASTNPKFDLLLGLLGLRNTDAFTGTQYIWLIIMALYGGLLTIKNNLFARLVFISLLIICCLSFLPNPSYLQYFILTVPLAGILTAFACQYLLTFKFFHKAKSIVFIIVASLVIIFFNRHLADDVKRYTKTGQGVIGVNNEYGAKIWNISSVKQVQLALDQQVAPNQKVLSFWPGYLLNSHSISYAGFENHFATRAARPLNYEQRLRYKVYRWDYIMEQIDKDPPAAIITKRGYFPPKFRNFLTEHRYQKVWEKNQILILKQKI